MFNYEKYLFNYTNYMFYKRIEQEATEYKTKSESLDMEKAYNLYQKCSIAHLPLSERYLGSMTINGNGTASNFYAGLSYYLMAAEDGDIYSLNMLNSLKEYTDPELDLSLISKYNQNNTEAMFMLSAYHIGLGNHLQRALELCCQGAKLGNVNCKISVADILTLIDDEFYLKEPENASLYTQTDEWKQIAKKYLFSTFANCMEIFDEILVVDSPERINDVFIILSELLEYHHDDMGIVGEIINIFTKYVSNSNSFQRKATAQKSTLVFTKQQSSNKYDFITDEWIISKLPNRDVMYRGYAIYSNHKITDMYEFENNKFCANVIGNVEKSYRVEVELDNDKLHCATCNCMAFKKYPGLCKHIVAVLYNIKNNI